MTMRLRRRNLSIAFFLHVSLLIVVLAARADDRWIAIPSEVPTAVPIIVEATFTGDAEAVHFIRLSIANSSDALVSVDWDQSALVFKDWTLEGPPLRSERPINFPTTGPFGSGGIFQDPTLLRRAQLPSPIAPSSQIKSMVAPPSLLSWIAGWGWGNRFLYVSPGDVIGLYLAWEDASGRHTAAWKWIVQPPPPSPPPD